MAKAMKYARSCHRGSSSPSTSRGGGRLFPHHVIAEFAGVGEIGHLPAVEVVFGHAVLGKTLEAIGIAGGLGAEQAVAADFLGRTAIVDLVELVPSTELAADAIPQQLEQFDALLCL